jgi:hypothetical protein
LTGKGLKLNLVKNDERLTFNQLHIVCQLKPQKNVVKVGNIVEEVLDFLRACGKINEDERFIFVSREGFHNG